MTRVRRPVGAAAGLVLAACSLALGLARQDELRVRRVSYPDVRAIVDRLADALPDELIETPGPERAAFWDAWVKRRDAEVRARLLRGEEDAVVNLLLFGTSFTGQPRVTVAFLEELDRQWKAGDQSAGQTLGRTYTERAADLVAAVRTPNRDARMQFARAVLERAGHRLDTEDGRARATRYLLDSVVRVRQEAATIARALDHARGQTDSTSAFAERSRVFRARGLASDSFVLTQFAVDRALGALMQRGLLVAGKVARVAVIGPGLDFVDKQEGLDFYPPQSLQPFAIIDSLVRLDLGRPEAIDVVAIDINPRVNHHLREARDRAEKGEAYRLVLTRVEQDAWTAEAVDYWTRLGDRIGHQVEARTPPEVKGVRTRGVAVRPDIVRRLSVVDANVVYDRVELEPAERFDLVIATNVLLYYDTFEQALALSNIASLLRPGGLLLSNTALLEIPEIPMSSGGYLTVRFSARDEDGEHMVWYGRER